MEFLIFVFILISVLSSLTRQAKKNRKKDNFFDPWSFENDIPEDRLKKAQERMEEEIGRRDILIEDEQLKTEQAKEQEYLPENDLPPEEAEEAIVFSDQELIELAESSFLSPEESEVERESVLTMDTYSTQIEKELTSLIVGHRLPLAIVMSEILGSPRALKTGRKLVTYVRKTKINK